MKNNEVKKVEDIILIDLKEIYEGKSNIFSIINNKYMALKNEISYSKYIIKHEAADFFDK